MNEVRASRSNYARAVLIAAVLFISYAYFYQGGGWNQNSRFDLLRAILDEHTLRIDSYHTNTEDKALFQGHYYSDKAPGVVLLSVPVVVAVRPLLRWTGIDPLSPRGLQIQSYLATILVVGLPMAMASACLFLVAPKIGSSIEGAAFAALSLGLATPIWAWATIYFGHALVGACLLLGFAAAIQLRAPNAPHWELLWALALGLAAGWATVAEYPAAPASAILALLALAVVWPRGWASRWRVATGVAIGALACVAALLAYQKAAFGSPFQMGYEHYEAGAFPWMRRGFLGLTFPRIDVAFKLLLGPRLGLFLLGPITAAAPFGLWSLWKDGQYRSFGAAAAAIAIYYWLFNASFSGWHAGWTYGPRYMGAGVPLLCVGLAPLWTRAGTRLRWSLSAFAIWGTALSLMTVATTAQPPQAYRVPAAQFIWPAFWSGHLSILHGSMLTSAEEAGGSYGSFNLGQVAGLHGLTSLLPLLAVWCAAVILWVAIDRKSSHN